MRWVFLGFLGLVAATVAIMGVRGTTSPRRPLMLVPDMDFQPKYKPQWTSRFFADGRSQRTPPAGTVAFGGNNYAADAGAPRRDPDFLQADDALDRGKQGEGWVAKGPLPVDLALLNRGRERFEIHCSVCHGSAGLGNGITTQYGLAGVPSYHDDRIRTMPDGEIYNTIVNGKGTMMPYGHQVAIRDRWAIVAYIRALQRSQGAKLDDVPASQRAELDR